MEYKLIAFDMDGTLLNSNKQISKKTQEAIARAVAYNKIVILNTGRNPAELEALKAACKISAPKTGIINNVNFFKILPCVKSDLE